MITNIIKYFSQFDKILGITAICIAGVAAFFSVYGIATLFAGAFVLTAIMASALEIGKVVAVSFLYRYWKKTQGFLKFYLSIATLVLMIITSLGIFGYLSAAYQKSSIEFKASQEKITMVEGQKTYLTEKITQSKSRIQTLNEMRRLQESRMNETLTNAFLSRNPLQLKQLQDQNIEMIKSADADIKTEQTRMQTTIDEIQKIDQQVNEMKFSSANKKDIRTFQFVAEQFGSTLDEVAKWFIFSIIFVFDPLAIALILAYNIVTYKEPETNIVPNPILQSPNIPILTDPPIIKTEPPLIVKSVPISNIVSSEPYIYVANTESYIRSSSYTSSSEPLVSTFSATSSYPPAPPQYIVFSSSSSVLLDQNINTSSNEYVSSSNTSNISNEKPLPRPSWLQ